MNNQGEQVAELAGRYQDAPRSRTGVSGSTCRGQASVPDPVDWRQAELPDTWPDQADGGRPLSLRRVIRYARGRRQRVSLPATLPGREHIPRYVLQEFHGLPNGNYSNRITRGYVTGFEFSMLGEMGRVRAMIARHLRACESVLDVGCGSARTAAAIHRAGVAQVWGLDISPYMLRHAASDHEGLHLRQGLAEALPFPERCFDGASVVFVFHEMPPRQVCQALDELARVLRPGGVVVVAEPSPLQIQLSRWTLWRRFGWRGLYFRHLMRSVHEPFLKLWHRLDFAAEARQRGFEVLEESCGVPVRSWVLRLDRSPAG